MSWGVVNVRKNNEARAEDAGKDVPGVQEDLGENQQGLGKPTTHGYSGMGT